MSDRDPTDSVVDSAPGPVPADSKPAGTTPASTPRELPPLPFMVFRGRDARDYGETAPMRTQPLSEAAIEGGGKLMAAGALDGTRVKLLLSRPGMSLTHVWFKSGFPLPRHSHDVDCLYYVVAGSLRLGSEELGPGDGFFVGADVPYAYVPGPQGVEVLEFRTANRFDIKVLANNPAYWDKALESFLGVRNGWNDEAPPSGRLIG